VIPHLKAGMLCLADRYYLGYDFWIAASQGGADLLWRLRKTFIFPAEIILSDGSYLSTLYPSDKDRKYRTNGVVVRVVEYKLKGVKGADPYYRLVTTILDPKKAPAGELAALYHERWEIETALLEVKNRLPGKRILLRSKTPELAEQEFYGFMLAYFAVRGIMHEAALEADVDPDRLSFLHAVRVIRRKLQQFIFFPPAAVA
jgi:IS4 transposase